MTIHTKTVKESKYYKYKMKKYLTNLPPYSVPEFETMQTELRVVINQVNILLLFILAFNFL